MASRFWAGGSSSEEESDHSSDSEVEISHQQQARAASRWAVESDSESDDDVRVVKSAKDKAFDNIEKACGAIKNHIKINDWTKILAEFDALAKHLDKAKAVLQAQGSPTFYIRTMVQLEDFLNEKVKNKAEQKKMSKENSKALIRMKGKLKKHFEGSLQSEVDKFRANPVESSASEASSDGSDDDDSDDDDSDDDSDKDSDDDDSDDKSASEKDSDDDSDDDDSDDDDSDDDDSWPSQSDSSDSDDSEDDGELKGRAKWLKQAPTVGKKTTKADKRERGPRAEKVRRDSIEVKKPVEEELKLSHSQFDRRIKEIVAQRGKKGTELAEQLATLRKLANYSRRLGPARQVIAYMYILGAQMFDASNKIDRVMSASNWKSSRNDLSTILTLLEKNPGFTLTPLTTEDQADIVRAGREGASAAVLAAEAEEEDASFVDTLPQAGEKGPIKVSGDLAAFVERLSEEYTKSLQQTDPHTSEYIGRLFDEGLLIDVAHRVQNYYDRKRDYVRASNVALIRAELIYYKHESIAKALHESQAKRRVYGDPSMIHPACNSTVAKKTPIAEYNPATMHPGALAGQPTVTVKPIDAEKDLRDVCLFVFRHADNRAKTRAMLCRIYHHALHDRFHEARDLLLMSHIQDNITDADVSTQILFNRMMAQLGLCAFRIGLIWEAHACLSEICTGSRTKELLAQGMQSFRFQERDPEQERLERRRQVPYHMHINLDLLETCHLVGAMLLEVPNMVNTRVSDRKRVVSKAFRKLLEFHERLVFEGPPENPRDHVVAAAKALAQGSWKKCAEYILGLSVWDLFPGPNVSGRVKEMVRQKIQVEALRTYLLAFSEEYDSVSLARLTEMFELDATTVHSVVSKMMINEELQGAWDQSSQSIVLHKNGRSNLHTLALQYSEKLATIVENNERMMDLRSGSAKDDWNNRRGGDNRRNQGGDNRDNRRFQGGGGGGRGRSGDRQQGSFRPHGGRGGGDGRRNQGAGGRGGGRGGGNRN